MKRPVIGKGDVWDIVLDILKVHMLFCTQYNVIGSEITVWDIVVTCLGHFECTD